jgi:hypothetical protein
MESKVGLVKLRSLLKKMLLKFWLEIKAIKMTFFKKKLMLLLLFNFSNITNKYF